MILQLFSNLKDSVILRRWAGRTFCLTLQGTVQGYKCNLFAFLQVLTKLLQERIQARGEQTNFFLIVGLPFCSSQGLAPQYSQYLFWWHWDSQRGKAFQCLFAVESFWVFSVSIMCPGM